VRGNDGEHYGQLIVYRFPSRAGLRAGAGSWNRINQDTEIARTDLAVGPARLPSDPRQTAGHPDQESLIYVQPLYLRAEGGRIPELKRVVVAHQNQVAMEDAQEPGWRSCSRRAQAGGVAAAPRPRVPATRAQPISPAEPSSSPRAVEAQARATGALRRGADRLGENAAPVTRSRRGGGP